MWLAGVYEPCSKRSALLKQLCLAHMQESQCCTCAHRNDSQAAALWRRVGEHNHRAPRSLPQSTLEPAHLLLVNVDLVSTEHTRQHNK